MEVYIRKHYSRGGKHSGARGIANIRQAHNHQHEAYIDIQPHFFKLS